jgi:hypothetical protein
MSNMDNKPQLDERIWQAWIQKNAAQDQVRFRRRVKVIGLVSLCLVLSVLLFEIHKVSADVLQLRPMPGVRSKIVLGGSSIAPMRFADDVYAMLHGGRKLNGAVQDLEIGDPVEVQLRSVDTYRGFIDFQLP